MHARVCPHTHKHTHTAACDNKHLHYQFASYNSDKNAPNVPHQHNAQNAECHINISALMQLHLNSNLLQITKAFTLAPWK
jgi:hypothetical protein